MDKEESQAVLHSEFQKAFDNDGAAKMLPNTCRSAKSKGFVTQREKSEETRQQRTEKNYFLTQGGKLSINPPDIFIFSKKL